MKKLLLAAALVAGGAATMNAQYLKEPAIFDNMSIGLDGGVTTPLQNGAFFGDMRGVVGLHLDKMITPTYGVGFEGLFAVNTSSWHGQIKSKTAFDSQYVGAYGIVNLNSLLCGYGSEVGRKFDVAAVAGAGWGHYYETVVKDHNFFATKVGLNFNFYPSEKVAISIKPSVLWDMSDGGAAQSSASYNANRATFNLMAGVSYALGSKFEYVEAYNQDEIDALNNRINELRGDLDNCADALADAQARNRALAAELEACKKKEPAVKVVKESNDFLQTVRYVFYAIGKSNVRADQLPNVEQIAVYLKNHPKATVVVKGYASQDGPQDVNERLANQRAESVKNTLINKYGIAANRIDASGQGIGHMFDEESWNRVAICVLENDGPVSTTTTTTTTKTNRR